MTQREIAQIWLVAIAGIAIIIWYHGNMTATILEAIGASPPIGTPTVLPGRGINLGTNQPIPTAGNEFGPLAIFGNVATGDVQPQGPDVAFKDIWYNMNNG